MDFDKIEFPKSNDIIKDIILNNKKNNNHKITKKMNSVFKTKDNKIIYKIGDISLKQQKMNDIFEKVFKKN